MFWAPPNRPGLGDTRYATNETTQTQPGPNLIFLLQLYPTDGAIQRS